MAEAEQRAVERIPAIDMIKATAIVAVVLMHAGPVIFGPSPDRAVRLLTFAWPPFHVPSFLVVAGFLYQRSAPIPMQSVRARLVRLLVPYLIASLLVQAFGFSSAQSARDVVVQLLTGSSLHIYYFIFILTWCTLLAWPISRTPERSLFVLLLLLVAVTLAGEGYAHRTPEQPIAGSLPRGILLWINEFYLFPLAYFLTGWLAAGRREQLARVARERAPWLLGLCLAGIAGFLAGDPWIETFAPFTGGARAAYTLCTIGALCYVPRAIAASAPVRFLSEATLGIYLYHRIPQVLAKPALETAPPLAQALMLALLGLGGAVALCWLARRLLGARARLLVGA
jgi:peptidoglycan/LPS O-acetylase OafA/YrhL